MRRAFTGSDIRHSPFNTDFDLDDADHPTTGAIGGSLGWADSIGRPEVTPFGQDTELGASIFDTPQSGSRPRISARDSEAASHRGRGPRSQPRTDAQLLEAICERVTEDELINPSDVSIEVHDGEVTLTGTVEQRYMKYRLEDLIDGFRDVKEIHNRVKVLQPIIDYRYIAPMF